MSRNTFSIALDPHRLVRTLAVIAVLLTLADLAFLLVRVFTGHDEILGLAGLFDLDTEGSIPSFFSGCLFLLSALLFALVAEAPPSGTSRTMWRALAGLFVFLSFDELFAVHERLTYPLRDALRSSGLFYYAWVLAYVPAVAVLVCVFVPVWRRINGPARSWLGRAAGTYLAGAVLMEMVAGAHHEAVGHPRDLVYGLLVAVEESLEMAGLIMLTHALLLLLSAAAESEPLTFSRSASSRM